MEATARAVPIAASGVPHGGPPVRWIDEDREHRRPARHYLRRPAGPGRLLQLLRELPLNFFLYVFRAAPFPVTPGLLAIGDPGPDSPVLITANYELTVRRVVRGLLGLDCWLLVAPTGGINVWCAAGDGHFSVDAILSILKTSGIAERVRHRRLLLPELCGNGINMFEVRRRTGWTAVFGPARAEDVPEYFRRGRSKPREMLRVTFTPRERLEMALAMWGSLTLRFGVFPLLALGWRWALGFAGLVAVLSLAVSFGCRVLPGRTFVQQAGLVALPVAAALILAGHFLGAASAGFVLTGGVLTLAAAFLVGAAFPGYSPYWPCTYSKLFFGCEDFALHVVEEGCIGCRICDEVCPVDCFEPTDRNTYALVNPQLCEGCMACVINCPTDTIVNEVAEHHRRETACG